MNNFRVKFKLDDETAKLFESVNSKSEIIAEALKWYLSFGKESLQKLERIEKMLASGVRIDEGPKAIEVKRDEIDDVFDKFVI